MVMPEPPSWSLFLGSWEIASGGPLRPATGSCSVFLSLHTSRGSISPEGNGLREKLSPWNTCTPWPRTLLLLSSQPKGRDKPVCPARRPLPYGPSELKGLWPTFQTMGPNPSCWGRLPAQDPFLELESTCASVRWPWTLPQPAPHLPR